MFADESVRGSPASPAIITVDGEARARFQMEHGPRPPIHHLTGLMPVAAEDGKTEFWMPASGWLVGPSGRIDAMASAFLGDGPVGMAVMASTPPGRVTTTAELSVIFHRATDPSPQHLSGKGFLMSTDPMTGVSACRIEHGDLLLASGITRMAYLDYPIPAEQLVAVPDPEYDTPDPYERPVQGEPIADRSRPGIDLEEERLAGRLAPIEHLFGIRPTKASPGAVSLAMRLSGWHMSPAGTLYGGSMAAACVAAVESAARTLAPPHRVERALDVKINFVRPVQCDGSELEVLAEVLHGGSRLVVVRVEAVSSDGKVAAYGQGTAALDER